MAFQRRPTDPSGDPSTDVAAIVADARDLVAGAGLSLADVDGIGLAVPGPIDLERGSLMRQVLARLNRAGSLLSGRASTHPTALNLNSAAVLSEFMVKSRHNTALNPTARKFAAG